MKTVTKADAHRLYMLLSDGRFHLGRDLQKSIPHRKVRAICQAYPRQFLSTQSGYKLVRKATTSEIEI